MSHLSQAPIKIRDIADLRAAAKHFGGELTDDKRFFSYQGMQGCDHAISLPGVHYQIGVRQDKKTGEYSLHFDPFGADGLGEHDGHKLVQTFGQNLNLLSQRVAAESVLRAARKKGVLCQVKTLSNGSLQLRMAV